MACFTVRLWNNDSFDNNIADPPSHVSLELHDGTYVSVFRSGDQISKSHQSRDDVARFGRNPDLTFQLFYEDVLPHPERMQNWITSYKNDEIMFDSVDTCFSVVYSLLIRGGCPTFGVNRAALTADSMKEYTYALIRYSRRRKKEKGH